MWARELAGGLALAGLLVALLAWDGALDVAAVDALASIQVLVVEWWAVELALVLAEAGLWVLVVFLGASVVAHAGALLPVGTLVVLTLELWALIVNQNALTGLAVDLVASGAGLHGALLGWDTFASLLVEFKAKEVWALKSALFWVVNAVALVSVLAGAWWAAHITAVLLELNALASVEVWPLAWVALQVAFAEWLAVAVIFAEEGVLWAVNWAAVVVQWLTHAFILAELQAKEFWALSVTITLLHALAKLLVEPFVFWAVVHHAVLWELGHTLAFVFVEHEAKELWALLLAGLVVANAVALILVEEGTWWALVNLAPVVSHWHALTLLEVGANTLLLGAVEVAVISQDTVASEVVEFGADWAVNITTLVSLNSDALTLVEIWANTVRLKAHDVTGVDTAADIEVPVGTLWAFHDVVAWVHHLAFASLSVKILVHHVIAFNEAVFFNNQTAAVVLIKNATFWAVHVAVACLIACAVDNVESLAVATCHIAEVVWIASASGRVQYAPRSAINIANHLLITLASVIVSHVAHWAVHIVGRNV